MSQLRHLRDWVEVAGVYVSRRSNDDRGFALERIQRGNERVQLHACRLIAPEQSRLISADAEHPQRFNSACMEVAACEYWHRRQARKPLVIDVDAAARPATFPIVAPVVMTALQSRGRPKISFSHPVLINSSRDAKGELVQLYAFWSSVEASQSAPSAAGVTPPVTK